MQRLRISGGVPLRGTVSAAGSKNAALPIMAASILAADPVRLERVPRLLDVAALSRVLDELGVEVAPARGDVLDLRTVDATPVRARYELVRRMRASFCVLGPLLARRGRAIVSLPGGCRLGPRPVDLHLKGLAALGAELRIEHGYVFARARRLVGTEVSLQGPHGPTVTGTANVLCAAVLAKGVTTILGAAREPEIVDLGHFLNALGARVTGLGTPTLRVTGVRELGGTSYRIIPDRIEAATLLLAAAISRGSAVVTEIVPGHLGAVLAGLRAAGMEVEVGEDYVALEARGHPRPVEIVARPYPDIPTDLQAQWTALLCLAPGRSTVCDRVFPSRFQHVPELSRLGARIELRGATAIIRGVPRLMGSPVMASDLRASAALVLAGLAAEGDTIVERIRHLDRGYQRLDEKLIRLGARLRRCAAPAAEDPAVRSA